MSEAVSYLNNPKLKRAYVPISFTQEQSEELLKCADDIYYFLENYYTVFSLDHAEVSYIPYPYQRKLIDALLNDRFVIGKMPRQYGKSITVIGYFLWKILFQPNQRIAILANKQDTAKKLLKDFKFSYERLPKWLQQGVTQWNAYNVEFENESFILAAATTSGAVRGSTFNLVFLDEFAHVPTNIAEEFFTSVYPTISSGKTSQIFIVSTPLGMNYYYKLWTDATEKNNKFTPIDVHWSDHPDRDEKWKEEQLANMSPEKFDQEFNTEFIGSTDTLISATALRELTYIKPMIDHHSLQIYREPEPGRAYVITADVSEGVGLDYSVFDVIDVTEFPYRLVAKYRDKYIQTIYYPEIIFNVAKRYNEAFVLVEHNDVGGQVGNMLFYDYEYENIFTTVMRGGRRGQQLAFSVDFGERARLGVEMSKRVKKQGCQYLKTLIEDKKIILEDFDTKQELSTFIRKNDIFKAEDGCHDDCVTPLIIFAWAAKQPLFTDVTTIDMRQRVLAAAAGRIEADLLPFPKTNMHGQDEAETIEDRSFVDGSGTRWFNVG